MRRLCLPAMAAALASIATCETCLGQSQPQPPRVAAQSAPGEAGPVAITIYPSDNIGASQTADANGLAVFATVNRYEKTRIAQHLEVKSVQTCEFLSAGTSTITVPPQFGTASTGYQACTIPAGNSFCPGRSYPTCAAIYYERTQHNNKSVRVDPAGPVDIFTYHWETPDGFFRGDFTPDVAVPVVRPKGEFSTFESWNEARGRWRVTLLPPDNDPDFDFTGERIREKFISGNDSCGDSAITEKSTIVKNGPPGNFGDQIGYDACFIEYYRAIKKTPCGYDIRQSMEINAPSDKPDVFTRYSLNSLGSFISGRLIDQFRGQVGFGQVMSYRSTTALNSPPAKKEFITRRTDCLRSLRGSLLLSRF